jgi:hypothetical protein
MRGQLAGQSGCIRRTGTLTTVIGQRNYLLSGIAINNDAGSSDTSVAGALNVRAIQYGVGTGMAWMSPRPWQWFELYHLNNPVPPSGPPKLWSRRMQGSAGVNAITNFGAGTIDTGTFLIDPLPDLPYALTIDCTCYPIALAADADVEAIPYQWTDAIPFGAAWMALLGAQTGQRMAEAEKYFQYFQQYIQRARDSDTPEVLKGQYEQQQNITLPGQLGVSMGKGG